MTRYFREGNSMVEWKLPKLHTRVRFPSLAYGLFIVIYLAGCATTKHDVGVVSYPEPEKKGIYHKVGRGETLWRIAKAYDVSINDIISSNNIPNAANVEENQLIFIPGAYAVKTIPVPVGPNDDDFIWPVAGKVVKYFHERYGGRVNKGIELRPQKDDTVKASRGGRVIFADYLSGYGYMVILDHHDSFYSIYAQNVELLVSLDQMVTQNTVIAKLAQNDDLYFEIRKNAIEQNPLYYLP